MEYSGEQEQFDVVVIGAGIMGSCAAYQLAKHGQKVVLLEQFDFLHHLGSSHGESRTIRATYPEDYYSQMVIESSRLWEEAESEIGYQVYIKTPQFDMGPNNNKSLQCVIENCKSSSLPCSVLDPKQVSEQFKGRFELPENWVGVLTQLGGVLKPTKAVSMFQTLAFQMGAILRDNMQVIDIKKDNEKGGVCVFTSNGSMFRGNKCIITIGAWMQKFVKMVTGKVLPIQPLHTTICYWRIKKGHEEKFLVDSGFPTFASYSEPYIYGTPSCEFPGLVKIAVHGGYQCDPDERTWVSTKIEDSVNSWIEGRFSGHVDSSKPVFTQSCMYSMTPDEDFVIDFLGGEFGNDVVIAGGFSGHGFKMGPVVGRILNDLVLNGEALGVDLSYFKMSRFEKNPEGNVKEFEDQVHSYEPLPM
ncbi:N-methyl-l-tryptophan oxidase [Thalictrum thalictroides]|uniref:N-methyl-l-tryptophan oxidase n=1 Tax=Thalictrum thalictroides TaxID=46969 RepID=A0A7J6V4R8_THATH|nr:N-methyl-l-tryptophan oxidase [Thalictrum thalictroides]